MIKKIANAYNSSKFKLISSACLLFVCLTILVISTVHVAYGWFASNERVEASGLSVSVMDEETITVLNCHAIYYDEVDGRYHAIDLVNNYQVITMPDYDYIFEDRNENTSLVLRATITSISDNDNLVLSFNCLQDLVDNNNYVQKYLSNVIAFKVGAGIDDGNGNIVKDTYAAENVVTYADEIYHKAKNALANKNEYAFVTKSGNEYTKEKSLNITIPYSAFSAFIENDTCNINIEIMYSSDLIEHLVANTPTAEGKVSFGEDLRSIQIGMVEG